MAAKENAALHGLLLTQLRLAKTREFTPNKTMYPPHKDEAKIGAIYKH